jgi:hypothetical protein
MFTKKLERTRTSGSIVVNTRFEALSTALRKFVAERSRGFSRVLRRISG